MLLQSLTFEDKRTGWKLEDLRLDRFNLLVAASGVGKTRILRAIKLVRDVGGGTSKVRPGVRFGVHLEHAGQNLRWELETDGQPESLDEWIDGLPISTAREPLVLSELIKGVLEDCPAQG